MGSFLNPVLQGNYAQLMGAAGAAMPLLLSGLGGSLAGPTANLGNMGGLNPLLASFFT